MSFVRRKLAITFVLGEGAFGESGSNTVRLEGLRASARIAKAGGPSMSTLQLDVFGMTLSQMQKLSTLGMKPTLLRKNSVTIEAGDDASGLGTVFQGTITNAYADMQGAPDATFRVEAHAGLFEAVAPAPVNSYPQGVAAATILSSLATLMGVSFENSGVNVQLPPSYYYGSARNQALAVVQNAGIEWNGMDDGILAIWPSGGSRNGSIPLISKDTGMQGYPAFTSTGIVVSVLFNPSIGFGQQIEVVSDLTPANRLWVVYSLDHELDCFLPKGKWVSTVMAAVPGLRVVRQ